MGIQGLPEEEEVPLEDINGKPVQIDNSREQADAYVTGMEVNVQHLVLKYELIK